MGTPTAPTKRRRFDKRLVLGGAAAGCVAALATVTVAAIARAADVALEVDDKAIPLSAFAFWTIVATIIGVVAATFVSGPRRLAALAVGATALSLVPAWVAPDDTASRLVLATTHLVAAAIVIPALHRLRPSRRD
jgi:hypothetical protein